MMSEVCVKGRWESDGGPRVNNTRCTERRFYSRCNNTYRSAFGVWFRENHQGVIMQLDSKQLASVCLTLFLGLANPAIAVAQTSRPDQPQQEKQSVKSKSPRGILAGPDIEDDEVSSEPYMTEERRGNVSPAGTRIPARVWMRMLDMLELSDDQHRSVRKIQLEYVAKTRAFEQEHAEAIRQARALRNTGRDLTAEEAELRRKAQQIIRTAPSPTEALKEIWPLLNESQQDQLSEAIATYKDARSQRMNSGRRSARDAMQSTELENQRNTRDSAKQTILRSADIRARRIEFLKRHQSAEAKGKLPSESDMEFEFDESDNVDND